VIEERTTVRIRRVLGRSLPLLLAAAIVPLNGAVAARPGIADVTETARGRAMAAEHAARLGAERTPFAGRTRIWELAHGDYFIAERLPLAFSVRSERDPMTGRAERVIAFDVEGRLRAPTTASTALTTAGGPWWLWLEQYCFTRWTTTYGWMDSCYKLHGMVNESDSRDFYSLEQYGSLGAANRAGAAIYSGFLDADRAATSAVMSWIDWSPRSSLSGSCRNVPLSVSALGVAISAAGIMCERWWMDKSSSPGFYRQTWSCGCFIGFGPVNPETREIDYLQLVSVANGKVPRWTLSQGFHAR
jgi:hypothetical protein